MKKDEKEVECKKKKEHTHTHQKTKRAKNANKKKDDVQKLIKQIGRTKATKGEGLTTQYEAKD